MLCGKTKRNVSHSVCTLANKAKMSQIPHGTTNLESSSSCHSNVSDFAHEWPKGGMIDHVNKAFDCARDLMSDSPYPA